MTFTVLVMCLVIVYAIKTICKELDVGGLLKERSHRRERIED